MNPKENDSDFCQPKTNKNTLDESNQETISGQPELFAELLSMFDDIPFNNFIVEGTWIHVKADKGATSNTFSFERSSTTGMLWKIQDTYLSADISFHAQAHAKLRVSAGTIVDFIPHPLNMRAKSVELSTNGVAITMTHTDNIKVSNMINILFEKISQA